MPHLHGEAIPERALPPAGAHGRAAAAASLAGAVLAAGLTVAPATQAQTPAAEPAPGAVALPNLEVTGSQGGPPGLPPALPGGQVARGGSLGLLGTGDILATPFSTSNYTSQLIQDQQARTAADTLINDSSVRLTTGSNGFDDTFQIRGYAVPAGDVGLNGLYGLISSNRAPAELIERIELLKGPGALINGIAPNGSIGGGINIVTKRAGDEPLTRLTTTYIGNSNFGLHADVARRYGANREWGIRFNGLFRDGEGSIDGGNVRNGLGALGLDYRGERLRWNADVIFQRDDTDNFRPQIAIQPGATAIPKPPSARSNWFPGTTLRQQDTTIATRVEYDLTDSLTAYAALGYRDGWNDQVFPNANPGALANGDFNVVNSFYDSYTETYSGAAGARWRFRTGPVGHTLNLGVTGFQQEAGNAYITSGGSVASNLYRPSALPLVTAARTDPRRASETRLTSIALADTMSFADDRLLVTLGVREQNVRVDSYSTANGARTSRYDASATTPLAGVVFRVLDNVSLYANYAQGLTRGTIVGAGYVNTGAVLAPFKSEQYEAGVKVEWGGLTTTAAVFQLTRPNQVVTPGNELAYDGEQRNRGVELAAFGELMPGLRGLVSATLMQPELTRTQNPAEAGNKAAGVPERLFSGALDWDVPGVPGLALSGRVIYTSGSYMNAANTLRFDGWTRLDLGARYTTEISGKPVTFRANLENATDERYWLTSGSYVTVGAPRTVIVSAAFDF
ncbi:TonB-dependent receptor [Pseudoroseomonas cervicalis]